MGLAYLPYMRVEQLNSHIPHCQSVFPPIFIIWICLFFCVFQKLWGARHYNYKSSQWAADSLDSNMTVVSTIHWWLLMEGIKDQYGLSQLLESTIQWLDLLCMHIIAATIQTGTFVVHSQQLFKWVSGSYAEQMSAGRHSADPAKHEQLVQMSSQCFRKAMLLNDQHICHVISREFKKTLEHL